MTQTEALILVIGAGPAGIAAAVSAAEAGAQVLLVDEGAEPGGQYLAGSAHGHAFQSQTERDGALLIHQLQRLCQAGRVDVWWGATVWSLEASLGATVYRAVATQGPRTERVQAGAVILASGARETVAPFPGWTLPGVMTVGAAQLLAKRHGLVPRAAGKKPGAARVLVAGSGLLLLPAAAKLAELGAEVIGIVETVRPSVASLRKLVGLGSAARLAPSLWARRDETSHYLSALRKHRIPYHFGRAVVRAKATTAGQLEVVDVARLDAAGAPVTASTEAWPVDLLCIGHGLVPNVELAQLAGANLAYHATLGGWVVAVDERSHVRTSIPGLFVAGEASGIAGAGAALLSGRISGMSAAAHLGRLHEAVLHSELTRTAPEQRRHLRFAAAINLFFGAPDALYRTMPDDTPVCRCEEVTAGQVRALLAAGAVSSGIRWLDGLKPAVRTGQGLCQGRTCGPILARMLAASTGEAPEAAGLFRVRPPVKPVPLAAMADVVREAYEMQHGQPMQEEAVR